MSVALDILNHAVRLTVGDGAEPRPGQSALTQHISAQCAKQGHVSAVAPTGSGKSYALLSAAAERVLLGERVVISTESLTLQGQIVDKDFPIVARAVEELYGKEITCAVLKGIGNYLDPRRLTATAALMSGVRDEKRSTKEWREIVYRAQPDPETLQAIDGADFALLKSLVMWAFAQYDDDNAPGDRHSCPLAITHKEWQMVSASSAEAAKEDDHWLLPKAVIAKERVSGADIVIVNHTLLAIQAAQGINIIIGTQTYGNFHHLLVDEAHALPDEVRKQGAAVVSAQALNSLGYRVSRLAAAAERWRADGETLAQALDVELTRYLHGTHQKTVDKPDDPLGDVGLMIGRWLEDAKRLVKPAASSPDMHTMLSARRAQARIDELEAAIASVSEFHPGDARWVESTGRSVSANAAPVNVGQKLLNNLFVITDPETEERYPLGVAGVSATLPEGFPFQAGLQAQTIEYESPFEAAYAESCLYIPNGAYLRDELLTHGRFDTKKHMKWASEAARRLIEANGGGALLLSASAECGRFYTEQLRAVLPGIRVYSQWDGATATSMVDEWKSDPSSVLIGTRSLMTGLDAPGNTNSLTILDRIPRRPQNALDDARVDDMVARGVDKYSAQRIIYAGDAALLQKQAVGRLIRSGSDRGMAAVLDPRLIRYKGQFPGYPEPTRRTYMKALDAFGIKVSKEQDALAFLHSQALAVV